MRQVTHALLTRPPLSHFSVRKLRSASFDLHVLSTPPAFILSQDQTLVKSVCFQSRITTSNSFLTLLFLVHLLDVRLNFSLQKFSGVNSCHLLFNYQCSFVLLSCDSSFRLSHLFELVNNFFKFFYFNFLSRFRDSSFRLSYLGSSCQQLF